MKMFIHLPVLNRLACIPSHGNELAIHHFWGVLDSHVAMSCVQ
jgi:hypothetical protein